ncbi:MAG: stage II sporulation protein M [Candidatus Pacebacteria bacterium]|nr:stage II sporulation protein M [Candidatus Paceibacterota bacterium]
MQYIKYLKESIKYLYDLKKYILFSLYIFVIAIFSGYIFAQSHPAETLMFIEEIKSIFVFEKEPTLLQLFFFIFENNVSKLFIILLLGIFAGLIPFFSVFINGLVLGVFAQVVSIEISWPFFFVGIIPHGIIELPVLIVSSAIGIRIGKVAIYSLFSKKESFKRELIKALKFFVLILIPLLFVAALIEAFITTALLEMV